MKRLISAVLFCALLAGCAHSPEPLPAKPSEEHKHHSGCMGVHRMSAEEFKAWENPSDWSEEDLKERIEWAKKRGGWNECRQVATYYMRNEKYEEQKHWLNEARKKCEALPCEDSRGKLIQSIDGWIADVDKTIVFYNLSEEEVLEKYMQSAESEDWRSAESLYLYYLYHHQFDRAAYWLEESRDLMIKRVGANEEARKAVLKMYDNQQNRLSKKAEQERVGGDKKTDQ